MPQSHLRAVIRALWVPGATASTLSATHNHQFVLKIIHPLEGVAPPAGNIGMAEARRGTTDLEFEFSDGEPVASSIHGHEDAIM